MAHDARRDAQLLAHKRRIDEQRKAAAIERFKKNRARAAARATRIIAQAK